jgi:hypothetical protein
VQRVNVDGSEQGRQLVKWTAVMTVTATCVLVLASGCTSDEPESAPASPTAHGSSPANAGPPEGNHPVELDTGHLSPGIDNRYWPMEPGRRWVYREIDEGGNALRVVVTVTDATRQIANGATARIVRDTVSQAGEVTEDTLDLYAQDPAGTIWYLGEETAEFQHGELVTREGSFEAGVDGALPGVIMPGRPRAGMTYRQEYYKGKAEDNGKVLSLDEMAGVPAGHFDQALLTADTNNLEPRVLEYKLYAPGVGPVLTLGVSGGGGREELLATTRVSAQVARAAGVTALGKSYG